MAVEQPVASDQLDTPSHSSLHRVIAADGAATAKSIQVSTTQVIISAPADGTSAVQVRKADQTSPVMTINTTNGNVGIGTTGPVAPLEIDRPANAVTAMFDLRNSTNGHIFRFGDIAAGSTYDQRNSLAHMFLLGGTEKVRIDSTGNVGIGTTAPDGILELNMGTNKQFRMSYNDADGSATDYSKMEVGSNGNLTVTTVDSDGAAGHIALMPDGNVGIGTTGPTAKGHIDQSSATGAIPVLKLDQADVSEQFIHFVGESTTDATQSLVDAADMTTPGAIVGWYKIYVEDVQATNPIADGTYYVPFYAAPTA